MITSSYFHGDDQVSSPSEIVLPGRIETVLEKIYTKHKCSPISDESRQKLSFIPEELAFDLLRRGYNSPAVIYDLDGWIVTKINQAGTVTGSPRLSSGGSPAKSPTFSVRVYQGQFQKQSFSSICKDLSFLKLKTFWYLYDIVEEMSIDSEAPSPSLR